MPETLRRLLDAIYRWLHDPHLGGYWSGFLDDLMVICAIEPGEDEEDWR